MKIFFNEKKKREFFPLSEKMFTLPLGKSLIDFIELDFLSRDISNPDIIENPLLDFLIKKGSQTRIIDVSLFNQIKIEEIRLAIKEAVNIVLDEGNEDYRGLTTAQRFFLYKNYPHFFIGIQLKSEIQSIPTNDYNFEFDLSTPKKEMPRIKEATFEFHEVFEANTIIEALYTIFVKMVVNNIKVKKCACCGKYFMHKDKAEKYCDRFFEGNKTCKDLGYQLKVENDELLRLYHTAYKTKHAQKQRFTRNKSESTKKKYSDALNKWRDVTRQRLKAYQKQYNSSNSDKEKENILQNFKEYLNRDLEV